MFRAINLAIAIAFLICASAASAAPVPADQAVGLDLRRTTLVVRDMDASLRFYRDGLGMTVAYDRMIRTPRDAKDDAGAEKSLRLVLLRANDDYIGMLGLMQYVKPLHPPRPSRTDEMLNPGDIVLLFNTKQLQAKFEKIKSLPNTKVGEAPHPTSYPSYDGKGVINVMFSSFYDPDGHYVEVNEVLDEKLH
jgi:catechol 2,3-dioxygenase-like lactoylglutathione lyase family enzyme